jgi:hypothetical protein
MPFASFSAEVAVSLGQAPNQDRFELQSEFTLRSASHGVNASAEPVTL